MQIQGKYIGYKFRNKSSCVYTCLELYNGPEVFQKFNSKQLEEFGLETKDFAKALAYATPTNQNAVGN